MQEKENELNALQTALAAQQELILQEQIAAEAEVADSAEEELQDRVLQLTEELENSRAEIKTFENALYGLRDSRKLICGFYREQC